MKSLLEYLILKYLVVPKPPMAEPGKKHIACIGDSITYGAGVMGKKEKTWEYFLNQALGDDIQVLNYGISARTLQKEGDYPYSREKFFRISHEVRANVYIIMLGTNDAKPYNWNPYRYACEMKAFLKTYLDLPNHPVVYVMRPPQCYVDPKLGKVGYDIDEKNIDGPILSIIDRIAKELNLPVIDLHTFTQNHSEWFDDGVHPNEAGNRAIAGYVAGQFKNASGVLAAARRSTKCSSYCRAATRS